MPINTDNDDHLWELSNDGQEHNESYDEEEWDDDDFPIYYDRKFLENHAGILTTTRHGYGFVSRPDGDVFVPARAIGAAITGDEVEIAVYTEWNGKLSGEVQRIIRRGITRAVGIVFFNDNRAFLSPFGRPLPMDLLIINADTNDNGKIVSAAVTEWPLHQGSPIRCSIEARLGRPGDPEADVAGICALHDIPYLFSQEINTEIGSIPSQVIPSDLGNRHDLRPLVFITIDGETSRDFDDAVHLSRQGDYWRLLVAIADVSHYVKEGTALDIEAMHRSTSVYFPLTCVPMLPEKLSNGICSLVPHKDRLVMVTEMVINQEGVIVERYAYEGVILSRARLTYENATKIITGEKSAEPALESMLHEMNACRQVLYKQRIERGSIDLDIKENVVTVDATGTITGISCQTKTVAHRLIEEFMITANETVAVILQEGEFSLYRIHEPPDSSALITLCEKTEVPWEEGKSPHTVTKTIMEKNVSSPQIIQSMMLRTMKQARYSTQNLGHFGLASASYTHSTSPIRRYPDLIVHRLLKKLLGTSTTSLTEEKLAEIADHASTRERTATHAERDMDTMLKTRYLTEFCGTEFDAIISGITHFGFFVEINSGIEGLVHKDQLESMQDAWCEIDDYGQQFSIITRQDGHQTYHLGDPIRVILIQADESSRRIGFKLA